MSDTAEILNALKEHREETRQDMHELRQAVVKIADAASEMGKTMARSEERHSGHEEATKRMSRCIDDHEDRLRVIEKERPSRERCKAQSAELSDIKMQLAQGKTSISAGWKVITVIGALVIGAATLVSLISRSLPQ